MAYTLLQAVELLKKNSWQYTTQNSLKELSRQVTLDVLDGQGNVIDYTGKVTMLYGHTINAAGTGVKSGAIVSALAQNGE